MAQGLVLKGVGAPCSCFVCLGFFLREERWDRETDRLEVKKGRGKRIRGKEKHHKIKSESQLADKC